MNVNQGATYHHQQQTQQQHQYAPNDRIPRYPDAAPAAVNGGHAPLSSLASSERARNPQHPARSVQQQHANATRARVPISALLRSNPGVASTSGGGRPITPQVRNELNKSTGSTSSERNTSQAREGGKQTNANGQQGARPPSFATGANAVGRQNESGQGTAHQRRPSNGANSSQTPRADQRVPQTASIGSTARSQDIAAINRQYNSTSNINRPGPSGPMRQSTSEMRTDDRLARQKIKRPGREEPIKAYWKTKDALEKGNLEEAFAPKEASDHIDDSDPEAERLAREASIRTHLEVYFPWRTIRRDQHHAKECNYLCTGAPHANKQIVCRFCKKGLEPVYLDHVSTSTISLVSHCD